MGVELHNRKARIEYGWRRRDETEPQTDESDHGKATPRAHHEGRRSICGLAKFSKYGGVQPLTFAGLIPEISLPVAEFSNLGFRITVI